MTAAHCFLDDNGNFEKKDAVVTLGLNNIGEGNSASKVQIANVTQYPDQRIDFYSIKVNDLAIIELESSVKFTDKVKPICLSNNGRYK